MIGIYIGSGFVLLLCLILYMLTNPAWGAKDGIKASEVPEVSPARLKADVVFLADSCYPRAFHNQPMLNKAADYIKDRLDSMGYEVEEQVYMAENIPHRNIIARIGPKKGAVLVVGAHYDVCGDQPGADDNGSAVAGLLGIASLLKQQEDAIKNPIELVAYSLEEPPFFRTKQMGSYVHAASLKEQNREVKGMICLEMIGYFDDGPHSQSYPVGALKTIYPSRGNFIAVVGKLGQMGFTKQMKKHMIEGSNIKVVSINAPQSLRGIDFSDHRNYWQMGYQAVMITNTAFFRNENYHQPTDTPDTLDYERMAEVVKGVFWAVMNL